MSRCNVRNATFDERIRLHLGLFCKQGRFDRMEERGGKEAWMPHWSRSRTVQITPVTNLSETMGEEHERVDIALGLFLF